MDLIHEDLHDQEAEESVQEHAELDDQRNPVRPEHRQERQTVLQHEEPDHLRDRLLSADQNEQTDEDEPHGSGMPARVGRRLSATRGREIA